MIASLPMYALPGTEAAHDRFWVLVRDYLRAAGIAAPDALTHIDGDLLNHWRAPDLVLSQTCSLPYRSRLRDHVTLIGTPDYGVEGCPPGYYRSVIIARSDDARDHLEAFSNSRFALNDPVSQSGWAALASERPEVLQGPQMITGSHRASMNAVQRGAADFAAIDAVTYHSLANAGETNGLRILEQTRPTPGLPLIAAKSVPALPVFQALRAAIDALDPEDRESLGLRALVALPPDAYDLPIPPAPHANAV
ncbi:PhnD/SsuA/transferrin family substrate-binding protein [Cognatiyoonia sp. IB215446]|uniref:phosphate/phosphite/phosphonate ABC transporter substrate-binding protein n=1 Tax=Cognatiyoonia sp. IB215446 TaxID=3097355 RepID=UPI002A105E45|nr:PhnD/SsuA/transferrin family substrate-binding protein [Cognatiyoonia sp. IB215446]MDX8348273.1 PhnD/SsuA/transferrin family substrate-binding protein [Cognatiyoonia sp. IB215446]